MSSWSTKVAIGVVIGVLLLVGGAMEGVIAAMDLYLRKLPIEAPNGRQVSAIPRETEHWIARGPDRVESGEIVDVLGTTNYLSRTYIEKNPPEGEDPRRVELHLAYYTGMIDTVPHVPERCFVGAGLQPVRLGMVTPIPISTERLIEDPDVPEHLQGRIVTTRLSNAWSTAPGVRVRLPRDIEATSMLVSEYTSAEFGNLWAGYFFIANGGLTATAEGVRALAFDLEQDYAFYLKVQFSTSSVTSAEELAETAASVLNDLYGEIMRCVPDWVEVEEGRYPPNAADPLRENESPDAPAEAGA
ncbi:MAG: exosortase-associated EpsI family protein [Planctomycetota bacterium]